MILNNEFFKVCPLSRTRLRRLLDFVSKQKDISNDFTYTKQYLDNEYNAIIKFFNKLNIYGDKDLINILGKSFWNYEINEINSLNRKNNKLM